MLSKDMFNKSYFMGGTWCTFETMANRVKHRAKSLFASFLNYYYYYGEQNDTHTNSHKPQNIQRHIKNGRKNKMPNLLGVENSSISYFVFTFGKHIYVSRHFADFVFHSRPTFTFVCQIMSSLFASPIFSNKHRNITYESLSFLRVFTFSALLFSCSFSDVWLLFRLDSFFIFMYQNWQRLMTNKSF